MRRTTMAFVAAAVSVIVVAACSEHSQASLATEYACSGTVDVTAGSRVSWGDLMLSMAPGDALNEYGRVSAGWNQLMRLRNHFGGATAAILKPGQVVIIPRKCGKDEKPSTPPQPSFAP